MRQRAIVIPLAALRAKSKHRPPGYFEDVVSRGKVVGDNLELGAAAHAEMTRKYAPVLPAEDWPTWALIVAMFSSPSDAGIGQTLARELGGHKSERFKRWHESVFGLWEQPCGCGGKLSEWNKLYPYNR